MLIYPLTEFYLGFMCGEKKSLKGTLHYCQVFTFAVVCVLLNKLLIIYILFFIIYLEDFFLNGLGSSHSNLRIECEK